MKRFFNPLAVTGYLDVSDVTDLYQKEKRDILTSIRQAIEGRKRNRYRHLTLQYETPTALHDFDEQVLVEVNDAMAKLNKEGYTIDDERHRLSANGGGYVYRWTILWTEE